MENQNKKTKFILCYLIISLIVVLFWRDKIFGCQTGDPCVYPQCCCDMFSANTELYCDKATLQLTTDTANTHCSNTCPGATSVIPICGDAYCDTNNESALTCPADCDTCGNGYCGPFENTTTCPSDCNLCGNGICDTTSGETVSNCPQDCSTSSDPPPTNTPPSYKPNTNPANSPANTNPNDNNQATAGDPISTATGEFYFTLDLIQLTGPMTLAFDINYGSQTLPDINPDGLPEKFESSATNALAETNSTDTNATAITFEAPFGEEIVFEEFIETPPSNITGKSAQTTARIWNVPKNTRYIYQLKETNDYFYVLNPATDRVSVFKKIIVDNKLRARIQSIEDRNGNSINYEYADNSTFLPSKIKDDLGREIKFNYTQIGNSQLLSSVQDHADRIFNLAYGANSGKNVLTGLKDPNNASTGFNYYAEEFISQVRNPLGNTPYTQSYINNGVVSAQKNYFNNATLFNLFQKSSSTTQAVTTNADGTTRIFEHDKNGRLVSNITDEAGNTIAYESDPVRERITGITDRLGNKTTYTYHNESGKIKTITNANGAKTEYGYLPQEQTFANPVNNEQITFTFYNNSYISTPDGYYEFKRDNRGNLIASRDIKGKITTFTYNSKGQVLTTTNPLGETITNTYNPDGTLATSIDPETGTTSFEYDVLKRPIKTIYPDGSSETTVYDARDRIISYTDANNNKYGFNYDLNGNLTSISTPAGKVIAYQYDAMDRLAGITNRNGKKTTISYNSMERISSITTPDNIATRYSYDPRGWANNISRGGSSTSIDYNAERIPLQLTTFAGKNYKTEVDKLGYITSVTNPDGNKIFFAWNLMGRLTGFTDQLKRSVYYGYTHGKLTSVKVTHLGTASYARNDLDLVTSIKDFNDSSWLFEYTKLGKLLSSTDPVNNKWLYGYDKRGRQSNITYPDSQSLAITYDGNGNIIRKQFSNGPDIQNQYDTENRLVSTNNIQFSYDNEDRITETTILNTSFGATYNDSGRLKTVTYNNNQFTVTYSYDATTGILKEVTDSLTGTKLTFNYNSDSQLISITRPNNSNTTYTYDAAGRIATIQHGSLANFSYTLDAAGQITMVDFTSPVDSAIQMSTNTFSYSYDAASRINQSGWETDAQGRVIKSPSYIFSWDGASRLTGINSKTLVYTGLGDVIASGSNTFFYNYAINYKPVVGEKSDGIFSRFYVWTPEGRLLYMIDASDSNKVYHYHFDHIGNTIAITDASGNVKEAYQYAPYGNIMGRKFTINQPFAFIGEWGVRMEGFYGDLYQMRARYYDANTGRFLSKEPIWPDITEPRSINPYQYAFNSPVNNIDITGTESSGLEELKQKASNIETEISDVNVVATTLLNQENTDKLNTAQLRILEKLSLLNPDNVLTELNKVANKLQNQMEKLKNTIEELEKQTLTIENQPSGKTESSQKSTGLNLP